MASTLFFDEGTVRDMALLDEVSEDTIKQTLHDRFKMGYIYTYIGRVLISMNPFQRIPGLEGPEVMVEYRGKFAHENPPHVYAVTDAVYEQLIQSHLDQAVIITGESGAGKTEAAKILMRYLSQVSGNSIDMERIKDRLMLSNPVLESFGNAKTLRNDNSSRFGKYLNIKFNYAGQPIGGEIQTYMLEKSRVVAPGMSERNFHMFYQLTRGATPEQKEQLHINEPEFYTYLNVSGLYNKRDNQDEKSNVAEDQADFAENLEAMEASGLSPDSVSQILRIVSGILWLGQIEFQPVRGNSDSCEVVDMEPVGIAAGLLGMDTEELKLGFLQKTNTAGREVIKKNLRSGDAFVSRDSLAKVIYARLFDWIVLTMNDSISEVSRSAPQEIGVGVLDIYGFEIFEHNGFEQFCINFVNESLQQVFIEKTLKEEQEEYLEEKIPWEEVPYFDNKAVCQLIEGAGRRNPGIFTLLCETCKFPRGDDKLFLEKISKEFGSNEFYQIPKATKFIGKPIFVILHYAGQVLYNGIGFVEKNKDEVTVDHLELGESSELTIMNTVFPKGAAKARQTKKTKLAGEQFMVQVQALITTLQACSQHFIRCMKPNEVREPLGWDDERVVHQIRYLGLMENIRIRRAGYAFNRKFVDFVDRYKFLSPRVFPVFIGEEKEEPLKISCLYICEDMKIDEIGGWQIGVTKIFVKEPRALFLLESSRHEALSRIVISAQAAFRMFPPQRFYKEYKAARVLQKYWRKTVLLSMFKNYKRARNLQSLWKTVSCKLFLQRLSASVFLVSTWKMSTQRCFFLNYKSASLLQSQLKSTIQYLWLNENQCARLLQNSWNMVVQRSWYNCYSLSRVLQGRWRSYVISCFGKDNQSVAYIQCSWRKLIQESFYDNYRKSTLLQSFLRKTVMYQLIKDSKISNRLQTWCKMRIQMKWLTNYRRGTMIKSSFRGGQQRVWLNEYNQASLVQSSWKSSETVRLFRLYKASSVLQGYIRGIKQREWLFDYKTVSKIQAAWKGREQLIWMKEMRAARKAQLRWIVHERKIWYRDARAAKRIQDTARRVLKTEWLRNYKFVRKIQAVWRGYYRRNWFVVHKNVRKIQAVWRGYYYSRKFKLQRHVRKIQDLYRSYTWCQFWKFHFASIKLQKTWRFLQCRQFFKEHQAAERLQQWTKSSMIYDTCRQILAAKKIQSWWKCSITKRTYNQVVASKKLVLWYKGQVQHQNFKEIRSAFKLQALWNGSVLNYMFRSIRASRMIISTWKCSLYSTVWTQRKQSIYLQSMWKKAVNRINYRKLKSASLLTCGWNSYVQRYLFRSIQSSYTLAAWYKGFTQYLCVKQRNTAFKLQGMWKSSLQRQTYLEIRAAYLLQGSWKRYMILELLKQNQAAYRIQGTFKVFKVIHEYRRIRCAIKIQAVWRGFADRRLIEKHIAASYLQSYLKMLYWSRFYRRHKLAQSFQRLYRGALERRLAIDVKESFMFSDGYLVNYPQTMVESCCTGRQCLLS